MQLVAYGAQDVYLTGSPQITFFKLVYRRHTNFAIESIEQTFNGTPGFGKKASATISRNGDLITSMFLQVKLPKGTNTDQHARKGFMHRFLEMCEIEIGGQRIDKHYNHFYEVMDELTTPAEKQDGYNTMVGKHAQDATRLDKQMGAVADQIFYMPLRFWFNTNPGLALPLIALQYHEVKLQMSFASMAECMDGTGYAGEPSVSLWVDYVYLDTDERRRFAQASHEYLIEQLQHTGTESFSLQSSSESTHKVRLNFNHPTKELIWFVYKDSDAWDFGEGVTKTGSGVTGYEFVTKAKLLLNGHDRFNERPGSYFRLVVPYQCHTRVPSKHIYCYSFALRPEEHQPAGSVNLSRIDNASLHVTLNQAPSGSEESVKLVVYAISYNILRIVSGMGGLAYSN